MDRGENPYAPGAGLQPPELTGRDRLIEDASIDMERLVRRRPVKGMLLLGLRGVGKTVVLNRLHRLAADRSIHTSKIEAPEGGMLPQLLAPELRRILYALDLQAAAGRRIRQAASALRNFVHAFKVKVGDVDFGIEPAPGFADTGQLEQDLPDLVEAVSEAAVEKGSAMCLFIDELQYLSREELAALIVSCHKVAQRNLPFLLIAAGLPQLAALAGNAKSYAERLFTYPQMGSLDPAAAREALVNPAASLGVTFEEEAVAEILEITECYPYFLQEWGFHVWNAAPVRRITGMDVRRVTPAVIAHLDANFFRVRFDRLTALQQKYLRAMAQLGPGPHKTGDIAGVLGVTAAAVATARQQLIDKGMVWSQRHGETAFTVPMFDEFMRRHMPVFEKHEPKRRGPAPKSDGEGSSHP